MVRKKQSTATKQAQAVPAVCAELSERLKAAKAEIYFLLDYMPEDAIDGLEQSVFARLDLFRQYFSCAVTIITNSYQSRSLQCLYRQIELGRLSAARLLNLYDYVQGINRAAPPPKEPEPLPCLKAGWHALEVKGTHDTRVEDDKGRCTMYIRRYADGSGIDYINYLTKEQINRRDFYDPQGFLSRSVFLEPSTGFPLNAVLFRPDHSVALMESYTKVNPKQFLTTSIELMDKRGHVTERFSSSNEFIAWWFLKIFSDPKAHYLLIGDKNRIYQEAYAALHTHRATHPNVRVIPVLHSAHADVNDPLQAPLGDNYRFVGDPAMRVDAEVVLTPWQQEDIDKRFAKLKRQVVSIPHHLRMAEAQIRIKKVAAQDAPALPPHSVMLAGRFDLLKHQDQAIDMLKKLLKRVPDATLHLFGTGPEEQRCKTYAAQKKLADRVIFHGFVTDLRPYYRSASCLICLSHHEGFSLVIQEALCEGCPVVSFNCRYGPSALIENGKNGYLTAPGDIVGMAKYCASLMQDQALRAQLSEEAIKSTARFEAPAVASQWAQLLLSQLPGEEA